MTPPFRPSHLGGARRSVGLGANLTLRNFAVALDSRHGVATFVRCRYSPSP